MADSNNSTIKKDGITTFFKGVVSEAKRIKWPKFSQLMKNTAKVLFFCILFALFFILCDFLVSGFLVLIGVGA
ncbi:MAG: preprotein translocase subunit SecE [Erysipelotrichaceae bacterium]|nr:preprotein translocase subunit SecE [Erysipelotrichaceae bacterium]MDY3830629.1 preprotein translocase subunit SecE [Erysipelotrichaceae bacterium]MDY5727529.1 preprotein translocase subunit SecE [Erysipelotrichaceae bacterium]